MTSTRPVFFFILLSLFTTFEGNVGFNIDEEMAPRSFSIKYYRNRYLFSPSDEAYLSEETLRFDRMTPTLVFGFGTDYEKVIKWSELKNSFAKNNKFNFDDLISKFQEFKSARKLVVIAHGWNEGNDDSSCANAWVSNMARTVRKYDRNVTTIALCWNSKVVPTPYNWWGGLFRKSSKEKELGTICYFRKVQLIIN